MKLSKNQITDKKNIWHPFTHQKDALPNICISHGKDSLIYDENGNVLIDAISSWWVNLHGHGNEYIAEAIYKQAVLLEHVIFAGFTHPQAILLSERLLAKWLPKGAGKAFFSDNGSTAVEVAIKMAIQYHFNAGNKKKKKIIAFNNSYHGDTFGSMSVSDRGVFTLPFQSFLFDVHFIDPPYKGQEDKSSRQLEELKEEAAVFVFEPMVQGASGMLMYPAEPLNNLLKICKENNIISIADEVMTGFFRTGSFFASDELSEKTDIICLSKGITGGFMPLGVTLCQERIFTAFVSHEREKTFYHGHSYTANPLSCAASNASLDLLESKTTLNNIQNIIKLNAEFVHNIENHPKILDLRHKGTILAIEYKTHEARNYLNSFRDKAYRYFIEKGVLIRPLGNIIYIIPPYCTTAVQMEQIFKTISDFTEQI